MIGVLLAQSGPGKKVECGTTALVIGANLPDIDVLWCTNHTDYLAFHRGITHAPAAILVMTLAAAAALEMLGRWIAPLRRLRIVPVCLLFLVGLLSHVALDALNSYGIRPLLPFSARWFHGDLLFIIDPWFWGLCLVAIGLLARGPRARSLWLFSLAAAPALAIAVWAVKNERAPLMVPVAVASSIALALALHGPARRLRSESIALGGLLCCALYLAGMALLRADVERRFMAGYPAWTGSAKDIALLPGAGDPMLWRVIVDDGERYHTGSMRALSDGKLHDVLTIEKQLDRPDVAPLLETREGKLVMSFMRFPFARVLQDQVYLLDARYRSSGTAGFGVYQLGRRRASTAMQLTN